MMLSEYKALAKALKTDKPVKTPDGKKIICYRVADERETEAAGAILDLLKALEHAVDDLRFYSTCETCAYRKPAHKAESWCKKNHAMYGTRSPSFGCSKWEWRGTTKQN